jgi:hypothetical protein
VGKHGSGNHFEVESLIARKPIANLRQVEHQCADVFVSERLDGLCTGHSLEEIGVRFAQIVKECRNPQVKEEAVVLIRRYAEEPAPVAAPPYHW